MRTSDYDSDYGKVLNLDQLEQLQLHAGQLRAENLRDMAKGTGHLLDGFTKAAKALLVVGSIGVIVAFVSPDQAYAGERTASADPATATQADNAALARFGLEISTITESVDLGSLWRAVREVVLTKRVSDNTQQLIWRRVWRLDPTFAYNDGLDSDIPDYQAPETKPIVAAKEMGVTH